MKTKAHQTVTFTEIERGFFSLSLAIPNNVCGGCHIKGLRLNKGKNITQNKGFHQLSE